MQNGTMIQYFHWYVADNILWKEVKEKAGYLSDIGITSVWLPPPTKGDSGTNSVGYDSYDLYDLGEFDQKGTVRTKYGTRHELEQAVKALKDANIRVIMDVVLNHKAGGDETERVMAVKVNEENRNQAIGKPEEIEAFTRFTFPGRKGKYSSFIWDHHCFSGADYNNLTKENAIYKFKSEYGNDWADVGNYEKGNYDFLMHCDVEFRNPAVREEVLSWAKWFHAILNFDGVRLDAVKHIYPEFCKEWLGRLRHDAGKDIFAVGEYWAPDLLQLATHYIERTEGALSLFDSSLHFKIHKASKAGKDFDMQTIFDSTLVKAMPDKAVTVTDNHDMQPLREWEVPVEPWFKPLAYALILLRQEGYPCVFYPDLFGANYKDKGRDGNEYEIFLDKVEGIEELIGVRKNNAYGLQRDYLDHGNCIGWTREGDDKHSGCAVLMSNGDKGYKHMEMGTKYSGKVFKDILKKHNSTVQINEDGWADFYCNGGSVSVWIQE